MWRNEQRCTHERNDEVSYTSAEEKKEKDEARDKQQHAIFFIQSGVYSYDVLRHFGVAKLSAIVAKIQSNESNEFIGIIS